MAELNIKLATIEDLEDIALISRTTWDGEDYLEGKAPGWIKDSTLYAGNLDGRVVGTFRLSPMPAGVLWMESLRIHRDFRGHGLGRELADASFDIGKKKIVEGRAESMEFATYVYNNESIHLALSQGFEVVERFLLMRNKGISLTSKIKAIEPEEGDFEELPGYIPCGWKYPRLCPEGIRWAMKRCDAFTTGGVSFLRKTGSSEITPLKGAKENPDTFLDGAEAAAILNGDSNSCVIIHESDKNIIETAFDRGYETWEPVDTHNVLVFRYGV